MINNYFISIIIPCFNQNIYLDECLLSVLSQTYNNWECIIINDGSIDNTEKTALKWCKKDIRFKYYFKQNGGLSSARNMGLSLAKGDYIQFLDCDDSIHPLKFELQINYLKKDYDIVICDYFPFDNLYKTFISSRYKSPFLDEKNFKENIILLWETKISIPCHTILFKKKIIDENIEVRFDEDLINHEDWEFWVKLLYKTNKIKNLKIALANYRIHAGSMSADKSTMTLGFITTSLKLKHYFIKDKNVKYVMLCIKKYRQILFYSKGKKNNENKVFNVFYLFRKLKYIFLDFMKLVYYSIKFRISN